MKQSQHRCLVVTVSLLLSGALSPIANAQVTVPNVFENGKVADADEVNENFKALADGITLGPGPPPPTLSFETQIDSQPFPSNNWLRKFGRDPSLHTPMTRYRENPSLNCALNLQPLSVP